MNSSLLHRAVLTTQYKEFVLYLLNHGAKLEAKEIDGFTPLLRSLNHKNDENNQIAGTLRFALSHGADVHLKDDKGITPLGIIEALVAKVRYSNREVVTFLKEMTKTK